MTALVEAIIGLVAVFVELLTHLVAYFLQNSYLAAHAKGLARVFYLLAALAALHLLLGLSLPFIEGAETYVLSPAFSGIAMGFSAFLLLLSLPLSLVVRNAAAGAEPDKTAERAQGRDPLVKLISYVLAAGIILGGLALVSASYKRKTLSEELCASAESKISETWMERGKRALELGKDLFGDDFEQKIPCVKSRVAK